METPIERSRPDPPLEQKDDYEPFDSGCRGCLFYESCERIFRGSSGESDKITGDRNEV